MTMMNIAADAEKILAELRENEAAEAESLAAARRLAASQEAVRRLMFNIFLITTDMRIKEIVNNL